MSEPNWDYKEVTETRGATYRTGRCHHNGKIYEGIIVERDGHIWVGGDFVK